MIGTTTKTKINSTRVYYKERIKGDPLCEGKFFVILPFGGNRKPHFKVKKVEKKYEIEGEAFIMTEEQANRIIRAKQQELKDIPVEYRGL